MPRWVLGLLMLMTTSQVRAETDAFPYGADLRPSLLAVSPDSLEGRGENLQGGDSVERRVGEETLDAKRRNELKRDLLLIGRDEVEGERAWQRKKNPMVAVFSNMFFPGLGELYNGRRIKVVIMVGLSTIYMGEAWLNYKRSVIRKNARDMQPEGSRQWAFHDRWYVFHKETAKDYLWWSGAIWIIGMLDAYIDAHLFDLRGYRPEGERSEAGYLTLSLGF